MMINLDYWLNPHLTNTQLNKVKEILLIIFNEKKYPNLGRPYLVIQSKYISYYDRVHLIRFMIENISEDCPLNKTMRDQNNVINLARKDIELLFKFVPASLVDPIWEGILNIPAGRMKSEMFDWWRNCTIIPGTNTTDNIGIML